MLLLRWVGLHLLRLWLWLLLLLVLRLLLLRHELRVSGGHGARVE